MIKGDLNHKRRSPEKGKMKKCQREERELEEES